MNYKIKQKDAYWEMETEKAISIEDCCYDITTDTFVIAVKHNKGGDYLVMDRENKIVKTMSEGKGVNRKFVLAPDKSVWVGMSSISTKKDGEIILPLYDRNRVEKEIIKTDLGVNYSFFWNDSYWGYVNDMWGDKPDKLLQYQFDKKGLYKTRKAYKLDTLYNANPFVQEDNLYLCQNDYKNNTIQMFKMIEPGIIEKLCKPISVGEISECRLINVDETGYKVFGIDCNEIVILSIDNQGNLVNKSMVYCINDEEIYSIMDFIVSDEGIVAFGYVSENMAGIIEINGTVAKEMLWQKDNILHCDDTEIETENKFAFHIMSDGKVNYYMATNIDVREGKCRKIYFRKNG